MHLHFIEGAITTSLNHVKQDIESIISFYEEQSFSTELGLAVGAVTGSKKLIQYASQAEQKD